MDIYHGEMINQASNGIIAVNVPLDPMTMAETPRRVIYRKALKNLQHGLALLGVVVSLVAFVLVPTAFVGSVALFQLVLYLLFRKMALPVKAKPWGRVLDDKSGAVVKGAIVRIFEKKFNKLLEMQFTDADGRYGFFASKSVYYITIEKSGYEKYISRDLDITRSNDVVIDMSVRLKPSRLKK